jgi:hypothetical protein
VRDAIEAREVDERLGHVGALDDSRLDSQASREVQMPLETLFFGRREAAKIRRRRNVPGTPREDSRRPAGLDE